MVLSKIVSIGTAVPAYRHEQGKISEFMQLAYALDETEKRKLRYLYKHSGIQTRYSVVPDYSLPAAEWTFFPASENLDPFPSIEKRMQCFNENALPLSLKAIENCLKNITTPTVTHLITVSCTGMSAPGLDLQLLEALQLPATTWRSSVNFMGCYAAIHALKIADSICKADDNATVLIVCVECCTLHFQREYTEDNITSGILFGDGAAAVLVSGAGNAEGLHMEHFYSCVSPKGKQDMVWDISSTGFILTLSGYIPSLIGEDFEMLVSNALGKAGLRKNDITHWCIHPGGKRILESIHKSLGFNNGQLQASYDVLKDYGNMSSPTVLFVLDQISRSLNGSKNNRIFGAAFGPGLTMETFIFST